MVEPVCTFQRFNMERRQRSVSSTENQRELTEQQMAQRARVRGLLSLMSSCSGEKRIEIVNVDFESAINIRRCALMKTRPSELMRSNDVGELLRAEMYKQKQKPIAGASQKSLGGALSG